VSPDKTADTLTSGRQTVPANTGSPSPHRLRTGIYRTELRLLLAVIALVLVFIFAFPEQFGSARNAENITRHAAILLVVALGQMFALLVGGFDISVAATMGLSATVGAMVMVQYGTAAGIAVGLLAAAVVGLINGILISRFRVSPFVATLGMMTFVIGFSNHISNGRSIFGLPDSFGWFGRNSWGFLPSTVGLAIIFGILVWALLNRTRVGLNIYAIGGSRNTSLLAGIPVVRTEILAYTMCGLLSGVAGLMLASRVVVGQASLGQGYELLSIATAVIGGVAIGGGVGRILGVILGVLLLSIITTGMNIAGLSEFIQQMLTGAVLIAAVLVDTFRGRGDRKRGLAGALKTLVGRQASAAPSIADTEHHPIETTTQQ
jgi:ribose/xylose/arabinose/galactoside ABC-type transport system permease subunit